MSISSCLIMIFSRWLALPHWGGMGEATILLMVLFPIKAVAQDTPVWEQYYEQMTSVDDAESESWANV